MQAVILIHFPNYKVYQVQFEKEYNKRLLLQSMVYSLVPVFTYLVWMIHLFLVDQIMDINTRKKKKKSRYAQDTFSYSLLH